MANYIVNLANGEQILVKDGKFRNSGVLSGTKIAEVIGTNKDGSLSSANALTNSSPAGITQHLTSTRKPTPFPRLLTCWYVLSPLRDIIPLLNALALPQPLSSVCPTVPLKLTLPVSSVMRKCWLQARALVSFRRSTRPS